MTDALIIAREQGHTVFTAGKGGNAATATQMATDLMLVSPLSNDQNL